MVTEDYVSFETAKLLKEKGFDVSTEHDMWYVVEKFSTGCHWNSCTYKVGDITREYDEKCCIAMPTLQMAMKWLRDVHKKVINVEYIDFLEHGEVWSYSVLDRNTFHEFTEKSESFTEHSYEEACEEGIKYCLENLI
jgi:hypothetical protein